MWTSSAGGHVEYECSSGCGVPGEQHYLVPAKRFQELVQAFQRAHFFEVPRTDPSRIVVDAPIIRLTYRDEWKIHEVVDDGRQNAVITALENRFKIAVDVDRYNKPSVSLYRSLVRSGWNVNTCGADHQNALSEAVAKRDLESARFLLQSGSDVTDRTLIYAAMSQNLEILRLVMKASRIKLDEARGANVLIEAARGPESELVRYVLDSGVSPNAREPSSGLTPLIGAVMNQQLENTNLLLARGANPNIQDSFGRPALLYAAEAANTGFITLLVHHGADVNATDPQGQTALMNAASKCYTWDVEALLKEGADPAVRDKKGRTAVQATLIPGNDPKCVATRKALQQALARPRDARRQ